MDDKVSELLTLVSLVTVVGEYSYWKWSDNVAHHEAGQRSKFN